MSRKYELFWRDRYGFIWTCHNASWIVEYWTRKFPKVFLSITAINFKLQYHYIFQHNSKTKTKILKVYQKNRLQFCHKNSDRPMIQQKIYIIVGCSDCSLLLNVYQHPVLRLIMSNERYPLILHVILTCRRNLYNHILLFIFKWKHGNEHCSWVWAVDRTYARSII